jgi:putative membrane protein
MRGRAALFYEKPCARGFLHVETRNVEDVRLWAFAVGSRNLLAGLGAIVALVVLHTGDEVVGRAVVLTACWYMLLAVSPLVSRACSASGVRAVEASGHRRLQRAPLVALVAAAFR